MLLSLIEVIIESYFDYVHFYFLIDKTGNSRRQEVNKNGIFSLARRLKVDAANLNKMLAGKRGFSKRTMKRARYLLDG